MTTEIHRADTQFAEDINLPNGCVMEVVITGPRRHLRHLVAVAEQTAHNAHDADAITTVVIDGQPFDAVWEHPDEVTIWTGWVD